MTKVVLLLLLLAAGNDFYNNGRYLFVEILSVHVEYLYITESGGVPLLKKESRPDGIFRWQH